MKINRKPTLTEKQWIEIAHKDNPDEKFYFYAIKNELTPKTYGKVVNDIIDLLTHSKGTYKQSVNSPVLKKLKTIYANDPNMSNYIIKQAPADIKYDQNTFITIADRDLRKSAHGDLNIDLSELDNVPPELDKCLIHHISGNETKAALNQLMLVPYKDNSELQLANIVHKYIHYKKNDLSVNVENIPIYLYDAGKWVRKNLTIAIK